MKETEVLSAVLSAMDNEEMKIGLERSVKNFTLISTKSIETFPWLVELADHVRKVKEEVLQNLDYYIDRTIKSVELTGARAYLAKTPDEVKKMVDDIIGDGKKLIVKAKSIVTEEIQLREYLIAKGHEVYETDLGELLIQLAGEKPMHVVGPAIHMSKETAARHLKKIDPDIREDMKIEELTYRVRRFLREKFIKADVGISGANSIAADTGAIFLLSNEGNIRNVTNLPPVMISITGVEKIMPTIKDAFFQSLVQAGYLGTFPPTYLSVIAGPSSTADIEAYRVYGVHGAKEMHVILYDGGRMNALKDEHLWEQLLCVRCGRCQVWCPIWDLVANTWGGRAYGGPMGIGWTAITEGVDAAAPLAMLCLECGRCKEVCPMKIDIPAIARYLKSKFWISK